MNSYLFSICIPTRNRPTILKDTLSSIFQSNVEIGEFEVVIYDSSDNNHTKDIIESSFKFDNLIYIKGENYGYYNLIEVLKNGNGLFLKLHNDYSVFEEGGLENIKITIKNNLIHKPVIFFTNNILVDKKVNQQLYSFDEFIQNISFFSTWSTSFGIWLSDFENSKNVIFNPMFPHTSLLFSMNYKSVFFIDNYQYLSNSNVQNKGGYNLFKTFAVDFLEMLKNELLDKHITSITYENVKKDLYDNFLIDWYIKTKLYSNTYTFELTNINQSINKNYSYYLYYKMIFIAYKRFLIPKFKNRISKILSN